MVSGSQPIKVNFLSPGYSETKVQEPASLGPEPLDRIAQILSQYHLWGNQPDFIQEQLLQLAHHYPSPVLELAIVEVLVQQWLRASLPKGAAFMEYVVQWLEAIATVGITLTVLPPQFHAITGLDPDALYPRLPQLLTWDGDRLRYSQPSPVAVPNAVLPIPLQPPAHSQG